MKSHQLVVEFIEGESDVFDVVPDFEISAPTHNGWGFVTLQGKQVAFNWSLIRKVYTVVIEAIPSGRPS